MSLLDKKRIVDDNLLKMLGKQAEIDEDFQKGKSLEYKPVYTRQMSPSLKRKDSFNLKSKQLFSSI